MWNKNDFQTYSSMPGKLVPSNSMGRDLKQLQISRFFYFLDMVFLKSRGANFSWKLALLSRWCWVPIWGLWYHLNGAQSAGTCVFFQPCSSADVKMQRRWNLCRLGFEFSRQVDVEGSKVQRVRSLWVVWFWWGGMKFKLEWRIMKTWQLDKCNNWNYWWNRKNCVVVVLV